MTSLNHSVRRLPDSLPMGDATFPSFKTSLRIWGRVLGSFSDTSPCKSKVRCDRYTRVQIKFYKFTCMYNNRDSEHACDTCYSIFLLFLAQYLFHILFRYLYKALKLTNAPPEKPE